jgi:D-sedoheptulose 7-phosphate isomerase
MKEIILNEFNEHIKTAKLLHSLTDDVASAAQMCIDCLKNGGKILLCGNGGSAADAQHIAAEIVGRFKTDRKGLSAIAITTDTSSITAIGNDFGYDHIFDRQVEALAKKGDILIGISTSGHSKNVINALKKARKLGCALIGLSGRNGGEMDESCDVNLSIPSNDTARIQEMHIIIGHTICHLIDQDF